MVSDGCGNRCSMNKVSGEDQGLHTFWAERLTSQGKFRELHLAVDFRKKIYIYLNIVSSQNVWISWDAIFSLFWSCSCVNIWHWWQTNANITFSCSAQRNSGKWCVLHPHMNDGCSGYLSRWAWHHGLIQWVSGWDGTAWNVLKKSNATMMIH